jgi:hypothetical protein
MKAHSCLICSIYLKDRCIEVFVRGIEEGPLCYPTECQHPSGERVIPFGSFSLVVLFGMCYFKRMFHSLLLWLRVY